MTQKTTPTSEQLAANIPPLVREYIDAKIRELKSELEMPIIETTTALANLTKDVKVRVDDMAVKVDYFQDKYENAPEYRITKAKIIRLCKELGIED